MEVQLPPTDKRALGKVEDSEIENVTVRASVPGQLVERKCACWMTFTKNGSMNLGSCWKIRKTAETCLNTSNECHSVHLRRKDLSLLKQVYATRSGEPMCHDPVVKARVKELKHLLGHNVFEVAWLSEVKSLTKVRYKWLQDMKRSAVKARFVAQQVAYGKHDDVLASTPPLAVARTLWAMAASRNSNSARYIGLRHSSTHQ